MLPAYKRSQNMQGADAERREAGERLAIQTYFVVAILVVAVPLATCHEYVARGAGAGLLSPTDAARARADIAARLEPFAQPPRRAARPVAGAYSVEVVSVNGAAVDADATLGALVRAVDARAGVARGALDARALRRRGARARRPRARRAGHRPGPPRRGAARAAVEAPFRGRHRRSLVRRDPRRAGGDHRRQRNRGDRRSARRRGGPGRRGPRARRGRRRRRLPPPRRVAAARGVGPRSGGRGRVPPRRRRADALAVAAAEAALADAFDRLEDLRAVGPLARPSDAPAVAARLLEAARTARDARAAATALRGAARALDAALDDPALALPARMPIEHLAAVYAPIVAPLVAPLVMGCAKETRRPGRL